ncbi:unnamed protein product, partial [Brenthis ino]
MQNIICHQLLLVRTTQTKMFKLVVLCAFLAAVVAEPSATFVAPLAYSANFIAPATTTITNQASSVIHPLPNQIYSRFYQIPYSPVAHFIKKRSPGFLNTFIAPSSYIAHTPLATTYAAAPLATTYAGAHLATTYSAPIYTTAAHFVKKRSAPLIVPSTYIAPSYSTPLVTSTYTAAAPILSTPYFTSAPFAYTHLIKKRSAPLLLTSYAAPAAYSHQSRIDVKSSPAAITSFAYSAPLSYASPVAFSHVF